MTRRLVLLNHDSWRHYVELDADSGSCEVHQRPEGEPPPWEQLDEEGYLAPGVTKDDGRYQILDGRWIGFYRYEGKMHLRIDDDVWPLDESATVEWYKGEERNRLSVSSSDGELVDFEYTPAWHNTQDWWTPNASPEDFDIAIDFWDTWNSAFRRNTFLRGLPGGGISHRLYFPSEENAMGAAAEINRHRCAEVGRVLCSEEPGFVGEYLVSVLEIPLPPPARTTPPTRDVIRFLSDLAREHGGYYRDASG